METIFWGLNLEQWTEIGISVLILLLVFISGQMADLIFTGSGPETADPAHKNQPGQ